MTTSLSPSPAQAPAESRKWLPFGFGVRFFIALAAGLIWLVPAWWAPQFVTVMILWDALAVVLWFADLLQAPAPGKIEALRIWEAPLLLARSSNVRLEIRNSGRLAVRVSLIDETPPSVRAEPPVLAVAARAGAAGQAGYTILPGERGDIRFGRLYLRYRTALGFAEWWASAGLEQTVRVLPDLVQARQHALYLIRSRQVEMEKRRKRQRGAGREFERLREYRQGDDLRDICWSATARRHQLITRTYEAERSQTVWIVADAGRLLRARVSEPGRELALSKLDYSVNAALALAQVALQCGDRVGLLAYGRAIQQLAGAGRGVAHLRTLVEALAQVRAEAAEANHSRAAQALLRTQSRRCLIVWITDFAETLTTPEVIEYATQMTQRHLVVFTAVSQPDLAAVAEAIPRNEEEMFRHAAALEMIQRRELLLRGLQQRGVLAFELPPARLATSLINEYLEIKDRSRL